MRFSNTNTETDMTEWKEIIGREDGLIGGTGQMNSGQADF
jgi:hypothetical protein